jgi:small conductance mechanosensitive channel
VPFAFDVADGTAEWTEIALALGLTFVAAWVVAAAFARLVRWVLRGVLGNDPSRHRQIAGRSLLWARLGIFAIAWAGFGLPALDSLGLPLALGMNRHVMRTWLLGPGLRVAAVLVVAALVLRISQAITERIERELATAEALDVIERTRRAQTLGRLVHNLIAVFVTSIALLMVLRELGVDIVPMLTGAGIVGVALGFGAQYLVRDVIAGFFLILENQVRVGDAAVVNGVGGIVEAVNLRTLVLRDAEGTVHVFQNGGITALANRSKDFAYYVIDVNVLYEQDIDRVVEVLEAVSHDFARDERFRPFVLEPLEVLGVDAFLDAKVTIKTRIKTAPLKQWDVGRELRRRIMAALDAHDIALQPAAVPFYVAERAAGKTSTQNVERRT